MSDSDITAVITVVVATGALAVSVLSFLRAGKTFKLTKEEHEAQRVKREARAKLGLSIRPSNQTLDDEGFIRTTADSVDVNLNIDIDNLGTKPAGQTKVAAWAPRSAARVAWLDDAGGESPDSKPSVPDRSVTLPMDDGRHFDTCRIERNLRNVPLMGRTIHLRVPCPIPVPGAGMIPIRVRVCTDGSDEVEQTYRIRLLREAPTS